MINCEQIITETLLQIETTTICNGDIFVKYTPTKLSIILLVSYFVIGLIYSLIFASDNMPFDGTNPIVIYFMFMILWVIFLPSQILDFIFDKLDKNKQKNK